MLVNIALRKLESDFYKPIDPQTPLAGESAGLRTLLNAKRVDNADAAERRRRKGIRCSTASAPATCWRSRNSIMPPTSDRAGAKISPMRHCAAS